MIIKGATITVVIDDLASLKKLDAIATKQGINIQQIGTTSSDEDPRVFEISGSFTDITIATEILVGTKYEKQWLFVRDIKTGDKVVVCSSQEEFEKMIHTRYYAQYEYKLSEIKNIGLMAFSDDFDLENQFTKELDDIFKSEDGWKPIQKIIYWSD